jgi:hypothetical protein
MKFWKSFKLSSLSNGPQSEAAKAKGAKTCNGNDNVSLRPPASPRTVTSTTPCSPRRRFNFSFLAEDEPIYEDFLSPSTRSLESYGVTFVELIKRRGTKLGVSVAGSLVDCGAEPRISALQTGSWAQRSDVLCVGDVVVSVNGSHTASMTQADITAALEKTDRVQLEVRYPLPRRAPSSRRRTSAQKVIQVLRNGKHT